MNMLTREQAKEAINRDIPITNYLSKARNGGYICPYCGSGTGVHGTGAVKVYPKTNTAACHACPDPGKQARKFDTLDAMQKELDTDFNGALAEGARILGFEIAPYRDDAAADFNDYDIHNLELDPLHKSTGDRITEGWKQHTADRAKGRTYTTPAQAAQKAPESPDKGKGKETPTETAKAPQNGKTEAGETDYRDYYKACRERLTDPAAVSYLEARGISIATARDCWIGYDPQADPAGAPGAMGNAKRRHPCPRLIIPTSRAHYVGRSIDPKTPDEYKKLNAKGSSPELFNGTALYDPAQNNQIVFVVEGAFDALSFLEAGAAAVALNSKSNSEILLQLIQNRAPIPQRFIVVPDNDPNPKTNADTQARAQALCQKIQALGYTAIVYNVAGEYHDANDALRGDRAGFMREVDKATDAAAEAAKRGAKPDNVEFYIQNLMGNDLAKFKKDIKTGFANLDREAGGLYSGLYVVAAISSLGKTTFTHQLCDNLAAAGQDVIFFSLEQSRLELVTKSIARHMAKKDMQSAVTSLAIRKGYLPQNVIDATREYAAAVGDRLSIVEGNFNCTVSFIGDYVRAYKARNKTAETGNKPVLVVDYLQVITPATDGNGKRQTVREAIDETVKELKILSRDEDIPVILISSVNRANYLTPIDFESLKESGGIEYTADVIWGLQFQCLNEPLFAEANKIKEKRERVKRAKAANPRKIELVCLKNRYGKASYCCAFNYYPAVDLFTEDAGADFTDLTDDNGGGDPKPAATRRRL